MNDTDPTTAALCNAVEPSIAYEKKLTKLVCMHFTSTSTCINFLSRFYSIKFFHNQAKDKTTLTVLMNIHELLYAPVDRRLPLSL